MKTSNCRIFYLVAIIICIFCFVSCDKNTQLAQTQEQAFLKSAARFKTLCEGISADLLGNSKFLNSIYLSRELLPQSSLSLKYQVTPEKYLNIPQEENHGALYCTGFTPIGQDILKEIDFTAPMDSIWMITGTKYPEILQQYYIHRNSFIRVFPYSDLSKLYQPKQDLKKLPLYQLLQAQTDESSHVKWFQPEWDPTLNEMIINVIYPMSDGNDLRGILGCKVSLKSLLKESTVKDEQFTGIIGRNGTLIMATQELYKNLGIPANQLNEKQIANTHDLRNSSNPSIQELMNNMIESPYTNFLMKVGEKKFYVECQLIPELNWVVFKMNAR